MYCLLSKLIIGCMHIEEFTAGGEFNAIRYLVDSADLYYLLVRYYASTRIKIIEIETGDSIGTGYFVPFGG